MKAPSHDCLTYGFGLPSITIDRPILPTPHIKISSYHYQKGKLANIYDGITAKISVRAPVIGRPMAGYLTPTKTIGKITA